MLKGRGKQFAPKIKAGLGGPRKPLGIPSTPSSARPSVERQSQPPTHLSEVSEASANDDSVDRIAKEAHEAAARASSSQAEDHIPTPQETRAQTGPTSLKRDLQEDEGYTHRAKRLQTDERRAAQVEAPETVDPTSAQSTIHSDSPELVAEQYKLGSSNGTNLKRNTRGQEVAAPPARPVSTGQQIQTTIVEEPSVQPVATSLTPIISTNPIQVIEERRVEGECIDNNNGDPSTRKPTLKDNHHSHDSPHHSPEVDAETETQAPRYRYPSPENMVRVVDEINSANSAIMGPAGGIVSSGLGPAGDIGATVRAGPARTQVSEIVPMAALNPDGTSGGIIEGPAPESRKGKGKKKRVARLKKIQAAQDGDDARATVEMTLNKPRRAAGQRGRRKKKDGEGEREKHRKRRAETPEGASEEEIDQTTMTMTDLCKDLRIGKKFSKHSEIKSRVLKRKADAARAKLRKDHPELILLMDAEDAAVEDRQLIASGSNENGPAAAEVGASSGPQMRIVDGQIVMDDRSLQIDRQKRAQAEQEEMEEIEENDFTRVITSGTYMKTERAQPWDFEANELFYKGLRMFGTDFEMIAKLFPHRNRRQIKLKYNKEEKINAAKITKALVGQKEAIDLEEFQKMADIKLEEVADIEAERERVEQEQMAEQAKHDSAKAEETRKKKAAIQSTSAAARRILDIVTSDDENEPRAGIDSAKENTAPAGGSGSKTVEAPAIAKGKNKAAPKRSKRNKHSHYAGGEEVIVLGTID